MSGKQSGFTLVEIAIVLVIIGLLLGGILKGQELINSARVRNLAATTSGIQAAYYGFIDRYRRVPGDWNATNATTAIGVSINRGGDDNGRLDNPATNTYKENNGLWEQLSKAGFIQGAFTGGASDAAIPDAIGELSPLNAFNNVIVIGRTSDYLGTNPVRLNVTVGRGVPVSIMREIDVKLDDGAPDTGVMRGTLSTVNTLDERFMREVVTGKFSDRLKITCESCGISKTFSSGAVETLPEIPPDYMTRTMTPVYSRDLWFARTVIRHLEGRGWRWSIASRNGTLVLTLVKGDIRISSGSHGKEAVAIVDAAARLARSHPGEI